MTFIQAIKTGLPIKRKNKKIPYKSYDQYNGYTHYTTPTTYLDPKWLLDAGCLDVEDVLATDWVAMSNKTKKTKGGSLPRKKS